MAIITFLAINSAQSGLLHIVRSVREAPHHTTLQGWLILLHSIAMSLPDIASLFDYSIYFFIDSSDRNLHHFNVFLIDGTDDP